MKKSFMYFIVRSFFVLCFLFILKLNGQVSSVKDKPLVKVDVPSAVDISTIKVHKSVDSEVVSEEVSNLQAGLKDQVVTSTKEASLEESSEEGDILAGAETVEILSEKIGFQGNWVKKREWLKEANKINTKIQEMVVGIQKARKSFYDKFSKIDKEMDEFYKGEGIEHGKVEVLFADLNKYIEKKRKKELERLKVARTKMGVLGEYQIKLDIMEDEIKSFKTDLDQLKLDIKSIGDLDKSIDARLKILNDQIELALKESSNSKDLSKQIWYIIDDKKAREVFYQIKGGPLVKVQGVKSYITSDLTQDFDKVLQIIRSQMSRVTNEIKGLEDRGIIIRDRSERLREIKLKELEEWEAKKGIALVTEKDIKEQKKDALHQRIYNFVVDVFARIYVWIKNIFDITDKKKIEMEVLPLIKEEKLSDIEPVKEPIPEKELTKEPIPEKESMTKEAVVTTSAIPVDVLSKVPSREPSK